MMTKEPQPATNPVASATFTIIVGDSIQAYEGRSIYYTVAEIHRGHVVLKDDDGELESFLWSDVCMNNMLDYGPSISKG